MFNFLNIWPLVGKNIKNFLLIVDSDDKLKDVKDNHD